MASKSTLSSKWPWLLVLLIPLWLAGAISDLMDARTLAKDGVNVQGTLESARWVQARRGRKLLECDVSWQLDGKPGRQVFRIPEKEAPGIADDAGQLKVRGIEVRCARSRPELAVLVMAPGDPWWVSAIIAGIGLVVLCCVIGFLIFNSRLKLRPR